MDKIIKYINNSNKPIYVYGKSGSGKTTICKDIFEKHNNHIVSGDV